jgi:hypothetical protein
MPDLFDLEDSLPAKAPAPQQPPQPTARQVNTRSAQSQSNLYTMPFGKHKGVPVLELPLDYLIWLWWKRDGDPLRDPLACNVVSGLKSYNIDPNGDMPEQHNTR